METEADILGILRSLPIFIITVFIAHWCAVVWFISRYTGWARLAKAYPQAQPFRGKKHHFGCLKMKGMGGYNNCVVYGADDQGIHLSMWPVFRIGHPAMLLPWQEMKAQRVPARGESWSKILLAGEPEILVTMPPGMVDKLKAQSGRELPYV